MRYNCQFTASESDMCIGDQSIPLIWNSW